MKQDGCNDIIRSKQGRQEWDIIADTQCTGKHLPENNLPGENLHTNEMLKAQGQDRDKTSYVLLKHVSGGWGSW